MFICTNNKYTKKNEDEDEWMEQMKLSFDDKRKMLAAMCGFLLLVDKHRHTHTQGRKKVY